MVQGPERLFRGLQQNEDWSRLGVAPNKYIKSTQIFLTGLFIFKEAIQTISVLGAKQICTGRMDRSLGPGLDSSSWFIRVAFVVAPAVTPSGGPDLECGVVCGSAAGPPCCVFSFVISLAPASAHCARERGSIAGARLCLGFRRSRSQSRRTSESERVYTSGAEIDWRQVGSKDFSHV